MKGEKAKQKAVSSPEPSLVGVPVESDHIADEKDGIMSEYLLAVYSAVVEWGELRCHT
jgi:hypothetical protein